MTYPFRNLIFEGGGVKGIAYVGAMKILEENRILQKIHRVGGTSAGAINAVLFAAGYSNDETLDILKKLDFNDFKDESWGILRDMKRLREEYGWYKGDYFREWIGELLKKKIGHADVTFKTLKQETGKDLFVYATNISTHFGEVYSIEHTPRMRVSDAVRRSMSIPLFFKAIRDDREDILVDGGVLNNFPIKLFDREKYLEDQSLKRIPDYYKDVNASFIETTPNSSPYIYNKETLGFRLDSGKEIGIFRDGQEPQHTRIENFLDHTIQLVETILDAQNNQHLHSDDWHRTIYIDTLGVKTTQFDLSDDLKNDLIKSGNDATVEYLKWWNGRGEDKPINHPSSTE